MEYENSKVHFKINLSQLVLQKLEDMSETSNPYDDNENSMGSINMEKNKKDCLDGENATDRTECCLSKNEKLAVPANHYCT